MARNPYRMWSRIKEREEKGVGCGSSGSDDMGMNLPELPHVLAIGE